MTEDQLQAKCYQWAYNNHPHLRGLIFSVPNGSTRHIAEAVKLKATGLTPGIPDILIIYPGDHIAGYEFKTETGVLSTAQIKIHGIWSAVGIKVDVVRSFEQWEIIIKQRYG